MGDNKRNILIIEDDSSIRKLLYTILSEDNYNVFEAENGKNAAHTRQEPLGNCALRGLRADRREHRCVPVRGERAAGGAGHAGGRVRRGAGASDCGPTRRG